MHLVKAWFWYSLIVARIPHLRRPGCPVLHPLSPALRSMASVYKYVCLGGGNSSGYVAKEFVAKGLKPGELCIITSESVVAYERPALSKVFLAPQGAARLPGFHTCVGGGGERQDPSWYSDKGIDYKVNSEATAVDLVKKVITLKSGEAVSFETLIIATGAEVVRLSDLSTPGDDLEGVQYLRDVKDGEALLAALDKVKAGSKKVVVVGGGYIGMEVAAALNSHGVDVSVVFPEPYLLARLLTPELAGFYEAYYAANGIKLVKGRVAEALEGDQGKVKAVRLKDGSVLSAELVVVGVGARPASRLFAGQLTLDAAKAVVVDANMATSVPGVYAIGDVASFPLLCEGGLMGRQEHVTHARLSAAQAVAAILGGAAQPYDYIPYFYSREFSLSWQFYGVTSGAEQVVHWGDMSAAAAQAAASGGPAKFGAYWLRGGKVVGAFIEGPSAEESAALKQLAIGRPVAPPAAELEQQGIAFALAGTKL